MNECYIGSHTDCLIVSVLFGKVNRVQSHANIIFSNAVCLLYQPDAENQHIGNHTEDDERTEEVNYSKPIMHSSGKRNSLQQTAKPTAARCPVLKFQLVNEYCNKGSGDIVDAFMKVVGVKMKTTGGKITHSQIVRVNLVDSEHPFFSRVWHGVHVLDDTSQLLTYEARKMIKENRGVWPKQWFDDPEIIREKLDFHSLVS